ncbi:MAG: AMP-binding protein [Nitrospirae bacterium]|nr:AMP-binding protein [Nitrospirota bacterium]
MLAAQVARTPEAVALSHDGRSWTYRDLDEASNRLAHRLSEQGARPGATVAVLFDRGADAIVAMTAVLKTGAACKNQSAACLYIFRDPKNRAFS